MHQYVIGNRDPRRINQLVDYVLQDFLTVDFNGDSFFAPVKVASFMRSFSEELLWHFRPWLETVLERYWKEVDCDHDEVWRCMCIHLDFVHNHPGADLHIRNVPSLVQDKGTHVFHLSMAPDTELTAVDPKAFQT